MTTTFCSRAFAITVIAPAALLLPVMASPRGQSLSPTESAALHARVDPGLGSLRAGLAPAPSSLSTDERSELRTAQQESAPLAAMRAGFAPSEQQWTWIAIGAGIVLLIVLL